MSTDRDTARIVRSWLRTDEHESADRVLYALLDQLDTTPQRRAAGWPNVNRSVMLAVAAVVVIAALLGLNFLVAPNVGSPGVEGTPSPDPSLSLLPLEGELAAGTYSLGPDFPVPLTFEVPEGWATGRISDVEIGLYLADPTDPNAPGIGFGVVENVVANPCGVALLDPPVGGSVAEMVEAISGLERFEATSASDITVDGYAGQEFEITSPQGSTCALQTWWNGQRVNGVGLGETNRLRIIDVDGELLMIAIAYQPAFLSDAGSLADAQSVVDSVRIGP